LETKRELKLKADGVAKCDESNEKLSLDELCAIEEYDSNVKPNSVRPAKCNVVTTQTSRNEIQNNVGPWSRNDQCMQSTHSQTVGKNCNNNFNGHSIVSMESNYAYVDNIKKSDLKTVKLNSIHGMTDLTKVTSDMTQRQTDRQSHWTANNTHDSCHGKGELMFEKGERTGNVDIEPLNGSICPVGLKWSVVCFLPSTYIQPHIVLTGHILPFRGSISTFPVRSPFSNISSPFPWQEPWVLLAVQWLCLSVCLWVISEALSLVTSVIP
jgi:hypothetical protein